MRQLLHPSRSIALVAVFAAYLLSFFHRFAPAGIIPELTEAFQTNAIGWLAVWRITETGARHWTEPSRAIK